MKADIEKKQRKGRHQGSSLEDVYTEIFPPEAKDLNPLFDGFILSFSVLLRAEF